MLASLVLVLVLSLVAVRATVRLPSYARGGLLARELEPQGARLGDDPAGCVEKNITVPLDWGADPADDKSAATLEVRYWVDNSCLNESVRSTPLRLRLDRICYVAFVGRKPLTSVAQHEQFDDFLDIRIHGASVAFFPTSSELDFK